MRTFDVVVSAAIASVVAVLTTVIVNMAAAELQGRLDGVCFVLLRLARRRLPADLRRLLHDEEWLPELHHILRREEARPITRLVQGVRYALGLLLNTGSVAAEVGDSRFAPNEDPESNLLTLDADEHGEFSESDAFVAEALAAKTPKRSVWRRTIARRADRAADRYPGRVLEGTRAVADEDSPGSG